MTFPLKKGNRKKQAPGTWWLRMCNDDDKVVMVKCPACSSIAALLPPEVVEGEPLGHDVAADGTVTPSADCPNDECEFHEMVTLEDWVPHAASD